MITLLQQTGYNALVGLGPSDRLEFTGFKLGDSATVTPGANYTNAQGNIVFTGTAADMSYVPFHTDALILQLLVGPDKPQMTITNIMLFVNDNIPFCLCLSNKSFVKLATVGNATGMRWMYQLHLSIPSILEKINVDNLTENIADIIQIENEEALDGDYITLQGRDQGILQMHEGLGRAVPLLFINNILWGNPFMRTSDDEDGLLFDGGEDGDGYKLG